MCRKPIFFAFSLCLLAAMPSHAATHVFAFGVTVSVETGCSVSAPQFVEGKKALSIAEPAISVSCTNATQYLITISPGVSTGLTTSDTNFPLRPLISGAAFSDPVHNLDPDKAVTTGMSRPAFFLGQPIESNLTVPTPDTISIAVTY